ncbi:MAG TPA: hypothetical protein VNO70_02925 [Blastocatellia bacterium]|nr:hypothetical protein [Blastocatellia bacterium]
MKKRAISVTLSADNLLWLRGQAVASGGSISQTLDHLVSEAKKGGRQTAPRSVVGTIEIAESDPELLEADAAIRALFQKALKKGKVSAGRNVNKGRERG